MRHALKARTGQRLRVRARVDCYGSRRAYIGLPVETVLLCDIADAATGELLADHLWFTAGVWSAALQLGDTIAFDARVAPYDKGYYGRRDIDASPPSRDWRLVRPTRVTVEQRSTRLPVEASSRAEMVPTAAVRCCRYYPDCAHMRRHLTLA